MPDSWLAGAGRLQIWSRKTTVWSAQAKDACPGEGGPIELQHLLLKHVNNFFQNIECPACFLQGSGYSSQFCTMLSYVLLSFSYHEIWTSSLAPRYLAQIPLQPLLVHTVYSDKIYPWACVTHAHAHLLNALPKHIDGFLLHVHLLHLHPTCRFSCLWASKRWRHVKPEPRILWRRRWPIEMLESDWNCDKFNFYFWFNGRTSRAPGKFRACLAWQEIDQLKVGQKADKDCSAKIAKDIQQSSLRVSSMYVTCLWCGCFWSLFAWLYVSILCFLLGK